MKYYLSLSVLLVSLLTNCIQWKTKDAVAEATPATSQEVTPVDSEIQAIDPTRLGAFSVSLSVKDLAVSKKFYESLGFERMVGSFEMNYFIMKNEDTLIGLFYGMFEGNILTFNPGWDQAAQFLDEYDDIRAIHKHVVSKDIKINEGMDMKESGPSSFSVTDPDGNLILIDQHR